jgi:glycosyltransferase involved in cell wall biosynthesis
MSRIRVCVDATPLLLRSAGVKTYVWHWTEALRRAAGSRRLARFPFLDHPRAFDHERSMAPRVSTWLRLALLHSANLTAGATIAWAGRRCDVFHASHQLLCPPPGALLTTTLYDMTCWLVPEMHSAANVQATKLFAERVMRRARGILAISRQSREDALRILHLDPDRVHVVYPGVPDAYFNVSGDDAAAVTRRYRLHKPYALFVGTIEPRKNVGVLLDAWERGPADFELVVAGSAGWGDEAVLRRLASEPRGVRYLGYVPETDLPGLTRAASVFVYPSLYEGFGLPLAQALAAGVPAVTSGVSSLPEVAGDGGLLVDPRSAAGIAAALNRLLTSPDLRLAMGAAARARAEEFRWERSAELSWRMFEKVAAA